MSTQGALAVGIGMSGLIKVTSGMPVSEGTSGSDEKVGSGISIVGGFQSIGGRDTSGIGGGVGRLGPIGVMSTQGALAVGKGMSGLIIVTSGKFWVSFELVLAPESLKHLPNSGLQSVPQNASVLPQNPALEQHKVPGHKALP